MRLPLVCVASLAVCTLLGAQPVEPLPVPNQVIPLYDGIPAGSEAWDWKERVIFHPKVQLEFLQNVVRPELLYFAPAAEKANRTAVIIAPGGGGVNLTIRYEGTRVAQHLARQGVAAFILKYRLVAHPEPELSLAYKKDAQGVIIEGPQKGQNIYDLATADALAAVAWVRGHANEFGCAPDRVGFVGFSAGGELACRAVASPAETRPNFFAPIYGATEVTATPDAPPVFLAAALDDTWGTDGSLALFKAWRTAGRPAEIHIFQTGDHGFLKKGGGGDHVLDRLTEWMQANGWLTQPPPLSTSLSNKTDSR